jgi:hypothetical protein
MKNWKAKNYPLPDKTDVMKMKEFLRVKYIEKRFAIADASDSSDSEEERRQRKKKKDKKKAAKKAKAKKPAADSSSDEAPEDAK